MRLTSILVASALAAATPEFARAAGTERRGAPAWRVTGGIPLAWRSASARPDSGLGLRYRTETPYLGLDLEGQVFPRRAFTPALPRWAEPLGLALSVSQRVLTSRLDGEELGSREQRAALDVLYERHVRRGARLVGRAGWSWHRFGVEASPAIASATHQGPRVGVDVVHPVHLRIDVIAGLAIMPWAILGGPETRARGDESEGSGLEARLGVGGPAPVVRGLGWRVLYDYSGYSDRYFGAGELSSGGRGDSAHHAILLGVTWLR